MGDETPVIPTPAEGVAGVPTSVEVPVEVPVKAPVEALVEPPVVEAPLVPSDSIPTPIPAPIPASPVLNVPVIPEQIVERFEYKVIVGKSIVTKHDNQRLIGFIELIFADGERTLVPPEALVAKGISLPS